MSTYLCITGLAVEPAASMVVEAKCDKLSHALRIAFDTRCLRPHAAADECCTTLGFGVAPGRLRAFYYLSS